MDPKDDKHERPAWTLFFEGDLYQRYEDYRRSHDFSKILMNNRDSMTSNRSSLGDYPMLHHQNWLKPETSGIHENGVPQMFSRLPSTPDKFLTRRDKRKRWWRTIVIIALGFLILGGVAAAAALIIHFAFIDDAEVISKQVNVTIPGNETSRIQADTNIISSSIPPVSSSPSGTLTTMAVFQDLDILKSTISNQTAISLEDRLSVLLKNHQYETQSPGIIFAAPNPTTLSTPSPTEASRTQTADVSSSTITTPPPALTGREIIIFNDVTGYINDGTPSLICQMEHLTDWAEISIRSTTPTGLGVRLSRAGEITWEGTITRYNASYIPSMQTNGDTTVIFSLIFNTFLCEDEGVYTCSLHADTTIEQTAKLTAESKPSESIELMIPAEIISHKVLRMTAVWNAGFPIAVGNLTWEIAKPGDQIPSSLEVDDINWQVSTKDCETLIKGTVTITPTMAWNGTKVTVKAVSDLPDVVHDVKPAEQRLLVVPANYCRGRDNDTSIPHPYTCNKYVRCFADRIVVYPCPGSLCFNPEHGLCDYRRES